MQETYIVSVTTEDGKLLASEKIDGGYFGLYSQLSALSHCFLHLSEEMIEFKTKLGSGTQSSASPSSQPTES